MKNKNWIIQWFTACEEFEIKPWEWDFKQSYIKDLIPKDRSNIKLFLEYKDNKLNELGILNVTNKTGGHADCDKEPVHIYDSLWNIDQHNVIRGETMNSFTTTFHNSILESANKTDIYNEIGICKNEYLWKQYDKLTHGDNLHKFTLFKNNIHEFEKFATLTHCIGNFTILPHWMNFGRYNFSQDYWDITLQSFFDFFKPMGCWKEFVKIYYLQPYVNNDKEWTVNEFWDEHFSKIGLHFLKIRPQNNDELNQYLNHVNLRIEERGKWIIKEICQKYNLEHFNFYKELKDMKIRFSNEI